MKREGGNQVDRLLLEWSESVHGNGLRAIKIYTCQGICSLSSLF